MAGSLAYGEAAAASLAIALAARPKLLLLDEPAAYLNPSETERFKELVRRICDDGVTVLLVEHDMHGDEYFRYRFCTQSGPYHRIRYTGPWFRTMPDVIKAYLGTGLKKRAKA